MVVNGKRVRRKEREGGGGMHNITISKKPHMDGYLKNAVVVILGRDGSQACFDGRV